MSLSAGERLGPYEIVTPLGAGGMGEVHRAMDTRLRRVVAIKVLPHDKIAGEERKRRFLQEARAVSALNHPHIVALYDIASDRGIDFLVLEFVPGQTLKQMVPAEGLAVEEVARYGVQIAQALAAAHGAGIVHRDIKPANIMVTPEGQVKVLDFGLAKLSGEEAETQSLAAVVETRPGMVLGTVAYMSPEQARGEGLDGRSDLFSLGSVLYEAATGRRPFQGSTPLAMLHQIVSVNQPRPSSVKSGLPAAFDRVIERAMAKQRERRYQSAQEMEADLERLRTATPSPFQALRPRLSRRWAVGAGGLAAMAAVGTWTAWRGWWGGAARIQSLAVLPLENLSGDATHEYFADGMTEALITDLGKIGSLQVISRSAVMRYKATRRPVSEIARELRVDAVVEGSVLRSGERILVTARLVSPATNQQIWSERYERDVRDVLALTGELAQAIAEEIRAKLTQQERVRLTARQAVNPAAHEAYLKGRYYWAKVTEEAIKKSVEQFEQASRIDPNYPLAYTGLADSYVIMGGTILGGAAPRDVMPKAKAAALKALAIDDNLAEAHASLAMVLWRYDWDWSSAEKEFQRAIQLNPSYATARQWHAWYLYGLGSSEESIAEMRRAERLDPQSPWISSNVGFAFYFARQYDRAIQQLGNTLEMDRNFVLAHFFLGLAYEQKSEFEKAIAAFRQAVELSGRSPVYLLALAHACAAGGRKAEALELLKELGEAARHKYIPAYDTAVVYAGLGDKEQALLWLERAHEEHSGWLVYLKVNPRLDGLHGDSRFRELLPQIGLPK